MNFVKKILSLGLITSPLLITACSPPEENTPSTDQTSTTAWYIPPSDVSWHWQLQGQVDTQLDVDLFDLDLFDTSPQTIQQLQQRGKRVVCYFSAGSYEDWREDKDLFPATALGKPLDEWEGERWLDIRQVQVREIMQRRLDLAKQKGCDAVEPDNVDAYDNDNGLNISMAEQLDYNRWLAQQAHQRGLGIALKNALALVPQLVNDFDFSINEQCHEYNECAALLPFIEQGKAVLNAEYQTHYRQAKGKNTLCAQAKQLGLRTLVLPLELDGSFRQDCNT